MSFLPVRALTIATAGTLLAVGLPGPVSASPGAPAAVAGVGERGHITTIPLTQADGERTEAALDGLHAEAGKRQPNAVRTLPLDAEKFQVAAVTWDAGEELPAGATVQFRVLEKRGWSQWLTAAVDEGGAPGETMSGTDPFVTGGADAVQVRISGNPAALPASLELNLIPANATGSEVVVAEPEPAAQQPADEPAHPAGTAETPSTQPVPGSSETGTTEVVPTAPAPTEAAPTEAPATPAGTAGGTARSALPALPPTAAVPQTVAVSDFEIVTRAEWGADEAYTDANWTPKYAPLRAAVVHHTAGTNSYTAAQSAGIVKAIFNYHTQTRGWGDIGYNFLVDKYGQIFEGRQNSIQSQPGTPAGSIIEAGHALGYNSGTLGISAMGDFTLSTAPDTAPVVSAMAKVIRWKFAGANIDQTTLSGLTAPATKTRTTYASGQELPRIFGHGDVASTSCPGGLYDRFGDLRSQVAQASAATPPPAQEPGELPWNADISFAAPYTIGRGWTAARTISPGDWDGNGFDDLMLVTADGRLLYYPAQARESFGAARQIGQGWQLADSIEGGVDWDGDGSPDLVARFNDGRLVLYPGNGSGGFLSARQIGNGWSVMRTWTLVQRSAGGQPAVIATDSAGTMRIYPTDGSGTFTSPVRLGGGWLAMTEVLGGGDWDKNGYSDLLVVDGEARLRLYSPDENGTSFTATQIGNGWSFPKLMATQVDARSQSIWAVQSDGTLKAYPSTYSGANASFVP